MSAAAASKPPLTFTTKLLPPPILSTQLPDGSSSSSPILKYPTPNNPRPSHNPSIFTDAMIVRDRVFVQEQGCSAEAEIDEDDPRSWHWVVYARNDNNNNNNDDDNASTTQEEEEEEEEKPVAVIRLVPPPHAPHLTLHNPALAASESLPKYDLHHEPYIKITRVAVLPEFRGYGLCRMMMEMVHAWAVRNAEAINEILHLQVQQNDRQWTGLVMLHAQVQVEGMYKRFGYETDVQMGTWEEEGIQHVGMVRRLGLDLDLSAEYCRQ